MWHDDAADAAQACVRVGCSMTSVCIGATTCSMQAVQKNKQAFKKWRLRPPSVLKTDDVQKRLTRGERGTTQFNAACGPPMRVHKKGQAVAMRGGLSDARQKENEGLGKPKSRPCWHLCQRSHETQPSTPCREERRASKMYA
jgi:hypothetical protein